MFAQNEREAFEAWCSQDLKAAGLDFPVADIKALRDGDGYRANLTALNGKWAGWKACAGHRMTPSTDQQEKVEALVAGKSLGEKLSAAVVSRQETLRPVNWSSLTDTAKTDFEAVGLAFAASLTRDETASAVITAQAETIEPELLEAVADEIDGHEHSARAASLRGLAKRQRAALSKARPDTGEQSQ